MSQKILVIQTAFIGDALLSVPLLKNLRQNYPGFEVTYLCRLGMGDFLSRLGLVQQVIEVDKKNTANYKAVTAQLQKTNWDWIICVHESIRSHLLSRSLRSPRKTSYKNFINKIIFNDRVERPMDLPEALRTLALVENTQPELRKAFKEFRLQKDTETNILFKMSRELMREIGLKTDDHKNTIRKFRRIPAEFSMEVEFFTELRARRKNISSSFAGQKTKEIIGKFESQQTGRKIFVLAPGSVWATKMWRKENYRRVCEELTRENNVILIGGKDERTLCGDLASGLQNIYNAAGETSLWESAELIACSDQVLTNDSGAMHLASLSSAKVLSIFGPTSIAQGYRPWNNEAQTIESNVYCRPCGRHGAKRCPIGIHACMKLVTPDHVLEIITRNPSR